MKTPKQPHNTKPKRPFYKRWWLITLAMIFLTPLGMFLWFKFTKKPHVAIKVVVSIIALLIWTTALVQEITGHSATFDIDGQQVTIQCEQLCTYVSDYGDSDALKILAGLGIKRIEKMPGEVTAGVVKLSADSETEDGVVNLVLTYKDNQLVRVANSDYTNIIYYSTSSNEIAVTYPARQEIANAKLEVEKKQKAEAERKTQQDAQKAKEIAEAKAAEEAKVKAEADRKAQEEADRLAAEAKVPSASGTAELCEKQFHQRYPYSGSKVHSILGVIVNDKYSADSRLYKVEVTIENAFGASYKAVMECTVQKSADWLQVINFNVY